MNRIVTLAQVEWLDHFPYKRNEIRQNPELLRQFLFSPDDPTLTDDKHCLVLDYDGFIEWFPVWNHMYEESNDDDWYKDNEGLQYLCDNINRTVDVIKAVNEMTPVLFINCTTEPFVDDIMCRLKEYETRSRNSLKSLLSWALGKRILIAETGYGAPLIKCSAVIDHYIAVHTREQWEEYLDLTWIPMGSKYDWQDNTKVKYLYHLSDVRPVKPFRLPFSCRRHGRVWAEYEGSVEE